MKSRKSLAITLQQKVPTLLIIGGEVVEIYFNRAKGVGKSEVCIVAHEDIKILGPHVVVKQEEELKEKFPYILANDRIWKKKLNEQQEKLK